MAGSPSEFWYVVRTDGEDVRFLADLDWIAEGGRWGSLGEAEVFTEEGSAVAVASRIPGAKASRFA